MSPLSITSDPDLDLLEPSPSPSRERPRDAMYLQLDWLRSFLAVANTGGLGAAAEALQVSPAQVSAQIEALEQALGVTLFDRSARSIRTSAAAEAFRGHAVAALLELQRGIEAAGAFRGDFVSRLRVGVYPGLSSTYLPSVIRELSAAHPNLTVEVVEAGAARLAEMVADGSADLAIGPLPPNLSEEAWCHRVIWREEMVAILREDDPLTEWDSVTLHDLQRRPLIGMRAGTDDEAGGFDLRVTLGAAATQAEIAHLADQPRALIALVRSGFGIGVIGRLALENIDTTGLAVRAIDSPTAYHDMAVIWTGRRAENAGITAFLDAQTRAPLPPTCRPSAR